MGSAWVFSICITFTLLFVAYIAISVNYARAFKVKSGVVSKIEEHEGYDSSLEQNIEEYLVSEGYNAYGKCANSIESEGYEDTTVWNQTACIRLTDEIPQDNCSVCIYRNPHGNKEAGLCAERSTYRVVAFFKFDLPIIGYWTKFQVGGETRYIYDFAGTDACG